MSWNKTAQSFLKLTILLCAVAAICFVMGNRSGSAEATGAALPQGTKVIARIWHGRVKTSKADEYYAYLKEAGIDKIEAIEGNLGAQVLRGTNGKTTEFTVISYWDSREAIKKFAGADIEKTHFLPKDPQYLLELEPKVKHFEVLYDGRK